LFSLNWESSRFLRCTFLLCTCGNRRNTRAGMLLG